MFKTIYFLGTGCGRPLQERRLPLYLVDLEGNKSIMLECGSTINNDDLYFPGRFNKIELIIITSSDIELYAGLPMLIHSMQLLNRSKPLKIIAPKVVNELVLNIINKDILKITFPLNFTDIETHQSSDFTEDVIVHTKKLHSNFPRYQVFIKNKQESTIFYTGKSAEISDKNLLDGDKFVIHDCTYSYDDSELAPRTGLASYKDVLAFHKNYSPKKTFLVHYSNRYKNPMEEIKRHRIQPENILTTSDGFMFNFNQNKN